jgi:hypothetical protein
MVFRSKEEGARNKALLKFRKKIKRFLSGKGQLSA